MPFPHFCLLPNLYMGSEVSENPTESQSDIFWIKSFCTMAGIASPGLWHLLQVLNGHLVSFCGTLVSWRKTSSVSIPYKQQKLSGKPPPLQIKDFFSFILTGQGKKNLWLMFHFQGLLRPGGHGLQSPRAKKTQDQQPEDSHCASHHQGTGQCGRDDSNHMG